MKETFYFSHDYNARNDEKIIKLLSKEGTAGYGIYWMIIEKLYEANGFLELDYDSISFDIRTECERIKNVIENYGLFVIEDGKISSKSVIERLNMRKERSDKARNSANIKWSNANAMRTQCDSYAIKERKGKERKDIIIASDDAKDIKNPVSVSDLYKQMGLPPKTRIASNLWQDEAANAVKYFIDGQSKLSSIFKCFKENNQKARIALSDCKELGKTSSLYFLKVYNELIK